MSVIRNSFLNRAYHLGADVVHDAVYLTHPLVHAIEQPIQNVYTEAKTVVHGSWNMSHSVMHLAAYWFMGWLSWTWFGDVFPREQGMITDTVSRAFKRARLE
jgi:hypothetical protein